MYPATQTTMPHTFSPARLEAFSDGVVAVIITIMVLELKVPRPDGLAGFREVLPTLGVYALSFAFVGIYWVNHHLLVHGIREASPRVLWANLVSLFCLSLLPFFTLYVHDKSMDSFSVAMYAASLTLTGFGFMLLRMTINDRRRIEGTFEHTDLAVQLKHWGSLATYTLCIPLAYFHPQVSLAIIGLVTLVWVIPTLGVERCEDSAPTPP
ncbi:MAG TPA: TMEM175 family protein [Acidobacteriaceae bacterium]|nr:TMEM175 family protein [Acidobacteriaceae bacterium]